MCPLYFWDRGQFFWTLTVRNTTRNTNHVRLPQQQLKCPELNILDTLKFVQNWLWCSFNLVWGLETSSVLIQRFRIQTFCIFVIYWLHIQCVKAITVKGPSIPQLSITSWCFWHKSQTNRHWSNLYKYTRILTSISGEIPTWQIKSS